MRRLYLFVMLVAFATAHATQPRWETLPMPPAMPKAASTGFVDVGGAKIYYATYGKGPPVVLLHGGLGNSDHFGFQVPALVDAEHGDAIDLDVALTLALVPSK